jgi:hypothetical protein
MNLDIGRVQVLMDKNQFELNVVVNEIVDKLDNVFARRRIQ